MTKQDEIQNGIIKKIVKSKFKGIVIASMRSGKTRCAIKAMIESGCKDTSKVLVLYPNIDIKRSWVDECEKLNFNNKIKYSTYKSSYKFIEEKFDYIVMDECHLIAPTENELDNVALICNNNKKVILMTGTLNPDTKLNIVNATGLDVVCNYPIEQAIKDGIVADYKIYVHRFNLEKVKKTKQSAGQKTWMSTDKKESDRLSSKVASAQYSKNWEGLKFAALSRMRFINTCQTLVDNVNKWQDVNKDKRYLLMCADSNVSKKFNIPFFNSKSKDDKNLSNFIEGKIDKLALVRKSTTGLTYPNLDTVVITNIDSNSENLLQKLSRSLLLDCENKEANIHVFISTELYQNKWFEKATADVPESKIIFC